FYIHSMRGGGAERVFAVVASAFAKRGYPVDLVLNRAQGPHLLFVSPEVRVVSLDCYTATAFPPLLSYVRASRPTCLLSAQEHNNLNSMLACHLPPTPFVPTVHNVISVHRRNIRTSRFLGTVAQYLAPLIHRAANAVGVVSEAVLRDIAYSVERPDKFH